MFDKTLFTNTVAKALKIDSKEVNDELALGSNPLWDSLHHIFLIVAIEEAFHIRFFSDEIPDLKSLNLLEKSLREKLE